MYDQLCLCCVGEFFVHERQCDSRLSWNIVSTIVFVLPQYEAETFSPNCGNVDFTEHSALPRHIPLLSRPLLRHRFQSQTI